MTRVSSVRSKQHVVFCTTFCINRWGWVSELLWHSLTTVVFMLMSVCLHISRLLKVFGSDCSYSVELLCPLVQNLEISSLARETVNITTHRDSLDRMIEDSPERKFLNITTRGRNL